MRRALILIVAKVNLRMLGSHSIRMHRSHRNDVPGSEAFCTLPSCDDECGLGGRCQPGRVAGVGAVGRPEGQQSIGHTS